MTTPDFGVTLTVSLDLLPTDLGGRTRPIRSGYRPICVISTEDGGEVLIGLCELQLLHELRPGASGEGWLWFASAVSDLVRSVLKVGSNFVIAEGRRPVGTCQVLAVEP